MVHGQHSVNCLTKVGNWEASTVCRRESERQVPLCGYHAAVDHVQRVAVEDLVLSQEDKPKSIGQLVRLCIKLSFSIQVYTEK